MLEKAIFILEKKGYSWDLRYQNKEKKEILMLSYHLGDITNIDNFLEAYHIYTQSKGDRFVYYFGKGPKEMKRTSKEDILKIISELV